MFLLVAIDLLDDVQSVMIMILWQLELALEEEQFSAFDVVPDFDDGLYSTLPFLDDGCDISQDLLALHKVFQFEIAIKEMEVDLEQVDSWFFIPFCSFYVEGH